MSFYNDYFDSIKKLEKIMYKTDEIPLEERKKIINSIYDSYDELIKFGRNPEYLAEEVVEWFYDVKYTTYIYNQLKIHRNKNINLEKYKKARILIDKILRYRYKDNMYAVKLTKWSTSKEFPSKAVEHEKLKLYCSNENITIEDFKEALGVFRETYFLSITSDNRIKLYQEFKLYEFNWIFEQMKMLYESCFNEKYELEEYNYPYKKLLNDIIYPIKSDDEINKIFNLLKKHMEEYNDNYYEIMYTLLVNDKYDVHELNNSIYSFTQYIEKNIDDERLKSIYSDTFKTVVKIGMKYGSSLYAIYDLNSENMLSQPHVRKKTFDILYSQKIAPGTVALKLRGKKKYYKTTNIIEQYILDYTDYYNKRKEEDIINKEQSKIKKEEDIIPQYENVISDFLTSGLNSGIEYCNLNNIKEAEFRYMIDLLKKYERPIYVEYEKYIESKKAQRYAILVTKLSKIFEEMVKSNSKFTLLDYYGYTGLTLDEATKIVKDTFNPSQQRLWAKFASKYKNDLELGQERIKKLLEDSNKIKYCIEMDNKGNILRSYDITKADKEQALLMLKEKNIPITNATFSLMIRKYFYEEILPNLNTNKKVLK